MTRALDLTAESPDAGATLALAASEAEKGITGRAKRRRAFSGQLTRTSSPRRRMCRACQKDKTAASYAGPGEIRCRKCVRDGVEVTEPRPKNRKRLCAACATERGLACFERHGKVIAECCDLCTSNPDIRVTLRQVDAAAVVLRVLRQVRAARLDQVAGMPTLGVSALQELAADALARVEAAR